MTVFRQTVRQLRPAILWYGFGLGVYAAAIAALYPSLAEMLGELEETYPREILDAIGGGALSLGTPEGFLTYEFFAFGPLVFAAFAIFASTGVLAGEEGNGVLELLVSLPLSRRRVFAEKVLALLGSAVAIATLICLGWLAVVPFLDLGDQLTLPMLFGATFAQLSLVAFVGATGLFLAAVAPTRGTAAAGTGAVLVVSYLFVTIGGAVDAVSWLRLVSPYYYADMPGALAEGVRPSHAAVVWGLTLVLGTFAMLAFEGRELGSERWQLAALLRPRVRLSRRSAAAEAS